MSLKERTGKRHLYFSHLQRLFGTLNISLKSRSKMIDVDGGLYCESCYHCTCSKCDAKGVRNRPGILCLLEHEIYNDRPIEGKCAFFVLRLAERAGVPVYKLQLHLNKARNDDDFVLVPNPVKIATLTEIIKITKQCIYPIEDSPVDLIPEQVEDFFMNMCDEHETGLQSGSNGVCNHPTGLRWDRVLRRDVSINTQAKIATAG